MKNPKGEKKMNKKYAMLLGVAILGLTLSGVTYAHWYKIIEVYGEVETGWLHLYPQLIMVDGPIEGQVLGKPVAWIDWVETCPLDNQVGFSISNVYPCLDVGWFVFGIVNDGTIPAGLEELTITGTYEHTEYGSGPIVITDEVTFSDPYWDPTADNALGAWRIDLFWNGPYGPDNEEFYGDCNDGLMASVWYHESTRVQSEDPGMSDHHGILQIDPDGSVYLDVNMHFYECLPQRVQFKFMVSLEYWNWNEAYPYWPN